MPKRQFIDFQDVLLTKKDESLSLILEGLKRFSQEHLLAIASAFRNHRPDEEVALDRDKDAKTLRIQLCAAARQACKKEPDALFEMQARIKAVSIEALRQSRKQYT